MKLSFRKTHYTLTCAVLFALHCGVGQSFAAESWPGENWEDALQLGSLNDAFSNGDISGAHWNNETSTLWLADNKEEMIWSLVESGNSFSIDESFDASGDLEGITQAMDNNVLYVMDEDRYIRAYNAETGDSIETWSIEDSLPSSGDDGKDGPEGITFVPDSWLSVSGFRDNNGALYKQSQYDFGGIFLVAHQNGGGIYAFDLASDGSYSYIGQYDTARSESSGLEFDRSTGILYISHNTDGNTLETTDLTSISNDGHRKFMTKAEFEAPNDSNLEGFAIKQAINPDNSLNDVWAFYTDDDGDTSDGNAIIVFKEVMPTLTVSSGNNQSAAANTAVSISPLLQLTDKFNNNLINVAIDFAISAGGGSLGNQPIYTDNSGVAVLDSWVLGLAGSQQVTATAGSLSTLINASVNGGNNGEVTATASADDGNVASNAIDMQLSTHWSSCGEQWLQLDLDEEKSITGVALDLYKGHLRSFIFDIATSTNGVDWDLQLTNMHSAGDTADTESFYFNFPVNARFIRYLGYGNNASNIWTAKANQIAEIVALTEPKDTGFDGAPITTLTIHSVSSQEDSNMAENLFDGVTSDTAGARWSAEGLSTSNQWVIIDLENTYQVSQVALFPYSQRSYQYVVQISSSPDSGFTTIVDRSTNTVTDNSFIDVVTSSAEGRYLRLEIQGADNYSGDWASINELALEGVLK